MADTLLNVRDLCIDFRTASGLVRAVDGVSFSVGAREIVGLVGESGSGKTISMLAVLGLIADPNVVITGSIKFRGTEIVGLPPRALRDMRGQKIAMVFQDPMSAMNPVHSVGWQIVEQIRAHQAVSRRAARARAVELLGLMDVPDPGAVYHRYPHQLSGGMRQRAMIAMALSCSPALLIADEPTTALDVTVQAQILSLLDRLRNGIRVEHRAYHARHGRRGRTRRPRDGDVRRAAGGARRRAHADGVARPPLHAGPAGGDPAHCGSAPASAGGDFRRTALACRPAAGVRIRAALFGPVRRVRHPAAAVCQGGTGCRVFSGRCGVNVPVLEAIGVRKTYASGGKTLHAVDGVSLRVMRGETMGLVGESGCGKSTLGRCLLRLQTLSDGTVRFEGADISTMSMRALRSLRPRMQMVFQDPYGSLNPRRPVGALIAEPLRVHAKPDGGKRPRGDIARRVAELAGLVGLRPEQMARYPHEFSGGQRQRIGIARALALEPALVVADEPVSALDVSVQAQVINLMMDLQDRLGLTYLFIAHDLAVVRQIATRTAVMYLGAVVETGPTLALFARPAHPYTAALLGSVPKLSAAGQARSATLRGEVPSPTDPPPGCRFHTRCPKVESRCRTEQPALLACGEQREVACHYPLA